MFYLNFIDEEIDKRKSKKKSIHEVVDCPKCHNRFDGNRLTKHFLECMGLGRRNNFRETNKKYI